MELPQDKWFTDSDQKFHYLDWGNSGATPMLLVHGLCCEAHYWDFFARNMRQNYHVIAIDQRGHGDSSWVGNYCPEQYVADLTKFVDKIELNDIVLIGHSLGAINVIIYAATHPNRVARLVIVDNGPEISTASLEQVKRKLADLPMVYDSEEEAVKRMEQESPFYSEDYKRHLVKHTMKRDESGRLTFKYDPSLRHGELVTLQWLWSYMKRIVCPILVVHGVESDLLLPAAASRMVETLPSVSLVDIGGAGHFVMGDNPKAFEAAISNFLRHYVVQSR
jgi:pimeloyl-ACP methyl ester carboxylesterase